MKKFFIIPVAFVGTLTLSGCGTETLSCTQTESSSIYNVTQEVNATFDGNKTKTIEAIMTMEFDKSYKDDMETLKSSIEEEMADYEKDYDVETDIKVDGTTLTYSMKADTDKMTDEAKSLFGFDPKADQSKEAVQKAFEDEGYTCK